MPPDPTTMTAEQLKALVSGASEEQVADTIEQVGVEAVLDRVFAEMAERFRPDKAGDATAQVQFNIDGHRYQVRVGDGRCTTGRGTVDDERVGLKCSTPTFLRLITGDLDGMAAVMGGRVRLRGDMFFAATMLKWFDLP